MPRNVSVRGAFQLTPSARRATRGWRSCGASRKNFNPRPPRGERHQLCRRCPQLRRISIHALRVESDTAFFLPSKIPDYFNPHPPRGGRPSPTCRASSSTSFQSTPSARRATSIPSAGCSRQTYFNPRPPRGGRLSTTPALICMDLFQSTPSARRATHVQPPVPRKGLNFNPRPPRGERQDSIMGSGQGAKFQSTPSARRATDASCNGVWLVLFQSTPSARRATSCGSRSTLPDSHFNPRPPRGGRLEVVCCLCLTCVISIHALREESDASFATGSAINLISIHALHEEGDSKSSEKIQCFCSIIHACAQFEKELYEGSGEMKDKSCQSGVFCSAKRPGKPWELVPRTAGDARTSARHPAQNRGAGRHAPPCSGSCCPADRTAGCPVQGRSARSARPSKRRTAKRSAGTRTPSSTPAGRG